ncbi:anthrone oxygenase family protein [Marinilactibacillus piezotolerans]|uniref:anthrone oxygenase family protein n=1 Tax=Marinilactibacillus piezotolerans TaxID=258723 RepID=UPI0009B08F2D|nr:anthrone oxygenase family protein [Marinilactibacillus piezotolerans]
MEILIECLVVFSLVGSGLVAGMFFAFSNFIMEAFGVLTISNGIATMQEINRKVVNPFFFLFFMGTAGTSLVLIILFFVTSLDSWIVLTGSLFYFIGCFLVTGTRNVPLNNQLEAVNAEDNGSQGVWERYLKSWTIWNHIRTASSLIAMICFTLEIYIH